MHPRGEKGKEDIRKKERDGGGDVGRGWEGGGTKGGGGSRQKRAGAKPGVVAALRVGKSRGEEFREAGVPGTEGPVGYPKDTGFDSECSEMPLQDTQPNLSYIF